MQSFWKTFFCCKNIWCQVSLTERLEKSGKELLKRKNCFFFERRVFWNHFLIATQRSMSNIVVNWKVWESWFSGFVPKNVMSFFSKTKDVWKTFPVKKTFSVKYRRKIKTQILLKRFAPNWKNCDEKRPGFFQSRRHSLKHFSCYNVWFQMS